jgi:hypothetical protein
MKARESIKLWRAFVIYRFIRATEEIMGVNSASAGYRGAPARST